MVQITPKGGLRTIKKAPWRDIEHPVGMYLYLMFKHVGEYWLEDAKMPRIERLLPIPRVERFQEYIEGKTELRNIGSDVSRKLREDIRKLERENLKLERNLDDQDESEKELSIICEALGVASKFNRAEKCIVEIDHLKKSGGLSSASIEKMRKINSISSEILLEIDGNQQGQANP